MFVHGERVKNRPWGDLDLFDKDRFLLDCVLSWYKGLRGRPFLEVSFCMARARRLGTRYQATSDWERDGD